MGLPIWREPVSPTKAKTKTDVNASSARSSIRRGPSVHGSRPSTHASRSSLLQGSRSSTRMSRSSLLQDSRSSAPSSRPRRVGERAPSRQRRPTFPPPPPAPAQTARLARRNDRSGVPPIASLLESTALPPLPPPPPPLPAPRLRNFDSLQTREREIVASLASLHEQAALLRRDTQEILREGGQTVGGERDGEAEVAREGRGARGARLFRPLSRTLHRLSNHRTNNDWPYSGERPASYAPRERGETAFERSVLPTPPLEQSEDPESDSLFLPDTNAQTRPSHPLSRSWRPESPIDGLGDRDRSPTPADAWEVMQTTITPDATLPSASSSFASARGGTDTTITEPERGDASSDSSSNSSSDSGDSDVPPTYDDLDADDLHCREEDASMMLTTASFASAMYNREASTPLGRARIAAHNELREEEGNRFALAGEPESVDIGFRLIEDALETEEGRGRVFELQGGGDEGAVLRMVRFRREGGEGEWSMSREGPMAHPVSPPVTRSGGGGLDAFLRDVRPDGSGETGVEVGVGLGDESIGGMRRVVDRLARRGDVPEEWWAGMGLNFPRSGEERESLIRGDSRL